MCFHNRKQIWRNFLRFYRQIRYALLLGETAMRKFCVSRRQKYKIRYFRLWHKFQTRLEVA